MTTLQERVESELSESRRIRFIRSAIAQSILQALTFGAAIAVYHYAATPQLVDFARQDGWNSAVKLTCPIETGKAGG